MSHDTSSHPDIRLIAIDIDGTMLRSDKQLTRATGRAVAAAMTQGVKIVLASARPPRSLRQIYEALELDSVTINYNGALIHDPRTNRNLFHQPLDVAEVRRVIATARKTDPACMVSLEILDKWYTDHFDEALPTETSLAFKPDFIGPLDAFLTVPITKLMLLAPPDRMAKITQAVKAKHSRRIGLAVSDKHLLQVMHPRAGKGAALQRVADDYHIDAANVMAIGDAPNDLSMIQWAGLSVAVGNAWPAIREAAKVTVPSNDADGVAHAIERFVLK